MAYDDVLAERVRTLLDGEPEVTEKRMFGGLAFLVGGHMAVAVSGQVGLMVRVDADGASPDDVLAPWVRRGATYARSLPPKD